MDTLTEEKTVNGQEEERNPEDLNRNENASVHKPPMPVVNVSGFSGSCFICKGDIQQPYLLPCLHRFCFPCIQSKLDQESNLACPECEKTSMVHREPDLKTKILMAHLSKSISLLKDMESMDENCSMCQLSCDIKTTATNICFECDELLCGGCTDKHCFTRFTFNHKSAITKLSKSSSEELKLKKAKLTCIIQCTEHKAEPLKFYCDRCGVLVCRDCIILNHINHKTVTILQAAEKHKAAFTEQIRRIMDREERLRIDIEKNEEFIENQRTRDENCRQHLKEALEEVKNALDKQFDMAIDFLDEEMKKMQGYQVDHSVSAEKVIESLLNVQNKALFFLQNSADEEFLACEKIYKEAMTKAVHEQTPNPMYSCQQKACNVQVNPRFTIGEKPYFLLQGSSFHTEPKPKKKKSKPSPEKTSTDEANMLTSESNKQAPGLSLPNNLRASSEVSSDGMKSNSFQNEAADDDYESVEDMNFPENAKKRKRREKRKQKQLEKRKLAAENQNGDDASSTAVDNGEKKITILKRSVEDSEQNIRSAMADPVKNKRKSNKQVKFMSKDDYQHEGMAGSEDVAQSSENGNIPSLKPMWRLDVWIKSDQFPPNITAVLCMGSDKVAVADSHNNKVKIFSTNGEFIKDFQAFQPLCLAYSGGRLIWCNNNSFVFVKPESGEREEVTFDLEKVVHPLTASNVSELFVGNGQSLRCFKWTKAGKIWAHQFDVIPKMNREGPPQRNMVNISACCSYQSKIFAVSEWQEGSIVFMDSEGKVSGVYHDPTRHILPTSMYFDKKGDLFAVDNEGNRLLLIDSNGNLLQEWSTLPAIEKPLSVSANKGGQLFLTGRDQFLHVYNYTY